MKLDHIALATFDPTAALTALVGDLGATVLGGGDGAGGFRWVQVFLGDNGGDDGSEYGRGMKVEIITPWNSAHNDFLARFLDRHGAGAHHLTFKVDDLAAELVRLNELGFSPVGVNLENPEWREAFLLPRQSHGTVVQLAESSIDPLYPIDEYRNACQNGPIGTPFWWDAPEAVGIVRSLTRVVLRSSQPAATVEFFRTVLGGTTDGDDLIWPGGGRIQVIAGGEKNTGVDHLEITTDHSNATAPESFTVAGVKFI